MRALSAFELLSVWERGLSQTPVERALGLLGAACADEPPEALASLSVGERDARLLTLREWTFGRQFVSLASCPVCGEQLELSLSAADLRASSAAAGGRETSGATSLPLTLQTGEYEVSFRLPNSLDLAEVAAVAPTASVADAAARLLESCLVEARRNGEAVRAFELPPEVAEAIAARMAEADPQAEVKLALNCPACGTGWHAPFDIEAFFWGEIGAWARRLLGEVHVLASSYGWRESDILNMSAWRRQFYIDLIGA
jgi:hypothetical protein